MNTLVNMVAVVTVMGCCGYGGLLLGVASVRGSMPSGLYLAE